MPRPTQDRKGVHWNLFQADAHTLPFRDQTFEVIVADPPYEGTPHGKRGMKPSEVGYILYQDRDWFVDAWRVLKPSGHLYLFTMVKEMMKWWEYLAHVKVEYPAEATSEWVYKAEPDTPIQPVDVVSWYTPNYTVGPARYRIRGSSNGAVIGMAGRAFAWRPILHFQKEPTTPLGWGGGMIAPNVYEAANIQRPMHEAMPWPNQLPERVVRYLLAPHEGLVLDLFSGTCTTAEAASNMGLRSISVDMSSQALGVGRRRVPTMPMDLGKVEA